MDEKTKQDYLKLQALILKIRDLIEGYIEEHSKQSRETQSE